MQHEVPIKTSDSDSSDERRMLQRRQLVYYLRAWDADKSEMLGHIVDFTSHGLMLISEEPVQIGGEYSLEVRLPDAQGDIRPINFRAICRWSGSKNHSSHFDSGFEVVDQAVEGIDSLNQMTSVYGFGF
ncbi:MAG: PilZ domain-containing protein [Gammaproteobacteria bacterium]|nr:PilZ domain-containing protein [Gammaproteobacteria bacterium]